MEQKYRQRCKVFPSYQEMVFVVHFVDQIHNVSMIIGQRIVLEAAYAFVLGELWEDQPR